MNFYHAIGMGMLVLSILTGGNANSQEVAPPKSPPMSKLQAMQMVKVGMTEKEVDSQLQGKIGVPVGVYYGGFMILHHHYTRVDLNLWYNDGKLSRLE